AARLAEEVADRAPRATLRPEPGGEGRPGDGFHGDEELVALHADVVDGDHVGVLELGERLRLAEEPRPIARGLDAPLGVDDLQRDDAAELGVEGGEALAHPAGAEERADLVAADVVARAELGPRLRLPLLGGDILGGAAASRSGTRETRQAFSVTH